MKFKPLSFSMIGDPTTDRADLSWIAACAGKPLPYAFVADDRGGTLHQGPLPSSRSGWESFLSARSATRSIDCPEIEVYFSPRGGAAGAICREIASAKLSVMVQAYYLTHPTIASAIVAAKNRGILVQVVLDKSQESSVYSSADYLHNNQVDVRIDRMHGIAHNKTVILDNSVVVTGSFNFTKSADDYNAENLLVIRDKTLAGKYTQNFAEHRSHSIPYAGRRSVDTGACSGEQCQ